MPSILSLYVRLLGLLLITGLIDDGLILGMLGLSFLSPALSAVTDSLETNGRG